MYVGRKFNTTDTSDPLVRSWPKPTNIPRDSTEEYRQLVFHDASDLDYIALLPATSLFVEHTIPGWTADVRQPLPGMRGAKCCGHILAS